MNKLPGLIAEGPILRTVVALLLAAVACFSAYGAVASLAILSGAWAFKAWLDRVHPQKDPEPTGAELMARLELFEAKQLEASKTHEAAVKAQLDALGSKVSLVSVPQRRGLRE